MSEHIQSVLFDKNYYTEQTALNYINTHPELRVAKPPHITENYIRIRQQEPDYDEYYYKTKHIPNHVEFIIGFPKHKGGARRISLDDAKEYVKEIENEFKELDIDLHLVGSVLRNEPIVSDIDFVTTDDLPEDTKYMKFQIDGINVDIWKTNNMLFGKLIHGYPKGIIIALRKSLKKKGYKLSSEALYKNGDIVPVHSIKQVFDLANIRYRPTTEKI